MLTRADSIALLKVLIAAAWADSRLTQAEMNYIKALARRFGLADADWLELEPFLEDAPSAGEVDQMFRDLLQRIGTPGARNEVIRHLGEILNADAQMTAEEHDFLDQYAMILRNSSTIELLVKRMKGFFHKPPANEIVDLEEFMRNKILFKLRRRIGTDEISPETQHLCLLGGLMGLIARADGDFDARESDEIRRQLQLRGKFSPEALNVLMTLIEEESVRGLDRSRLIGELLHNATFEDKASVLDLLFAVAAADGSLTHAELEALRGVASAMNLSHRQYIDAKVRARPNNSIEPTGITDQDTLQV